MEKKSRIRRFLAKVGGIRLSQIFDKFRKPFNFCWKAGLAILAIVFLIQLAEALIDTCKDHLGLTHYSWGDENLGMNIEIRHFSNNQAATYNKLTDKRLSPKVRWISCVPERDSLTVFCDKEGKRGYLNVNTGKVVINGQYNHAWHFSEGLAAVVADNGKVGFINYDNEMVIPAVYDYVVDYEGDALEILKEDQTLRIYAKKPIEQEVILRKGAYQVDGALIQVHKAKSAQPFVTMEKGAIEPLMAKLKLKVHALGDFELVKIDKDTQKGLEGVAFEVSSDANFKENVQRLVSDGDGKIELQDLIVGTYYYREVETVEPYIRDENIYSWYAEGPWEDNADVRSR